MSHVPFYKFLAIWNATQRFTHVLPKFHEELANWLETTQHNPKRLLMAYRYSGKSYIKDVYVAWRLYCDPNFICINISATQKLARIACRNIKEIIQKHPLTQHLVPQSTHGQWQADIFTVVRSTTPREPSVTVGALGSQITGMHADLVIADDLETHSNSLTQEARERIENYARELMSVAKEVLYIGTPHHEESLYIKVEHSWRYLTEKFPVIKADNTPQCPELHDWDWINQKKQGGEEGSGNNWWLSQYMLIPVRSMEAVLNWDAVKLYDKDLLRGNFGISNKSDRIGLYDIIDGKEIAQKKAYWDPASGLKNRDESVIALAMRTYEGEVFVHDALALPPFNAERGMQDQFEAVLKFCKRYSATQLIVEKNFSLQLAVDLKKLISERDLGISITEHTRTNMMNKKTFIGQAIEPLLMTGKLHVHNQVLANTNFKRQFQDFPNGRHDDVIDAVAGAIQSLGRVTGVNGSIGRMGRAVMANTYRPLSSRAA